MSKSPTLDQFQLHPFGGYCTCYSAPYSECAVCKAVAEQQERWKSLTPEQKEQANKEYDLLYPGTYDSVTGGR